MNDKNDKLKNVVLWTFYISISFVGFFFLFCSITITIAPTFFPETDISGFKSYINVFGNVLSFLSVLLSVYSMYQASSGNKQMNKMLKMTQDIINEQEHTKETMREVIYKIDAFLPKLETTWKHDEIIK